MANFKLIIYYIFLTYYTNAICKEYCNEDTHTLDNILFPAFFLIYKISVWDCQTKDNQILKSEYGNCYLKELLTQLLKHILTIYLNLKKSGQTFK